MSESEKPPEEPVPDEPAAGPDEPTDLPPPPSMRDFRSAEELEEVFRVGNEMGVRAAIDEILAPAGIEAFRHDRQSHALPIPAALPGELSVAVDRSVAETARQLLHEALADGVLPDGRVVGGEGPVAV